MHARSATRLAIVLSGLALLAPAPSSARAGEPAWTSPQSLIAARFGPRHATAVDSAGRLHVVVEDRTTHGLWYLTNAGGVWTRERLSSGLDLDPAIDVGAGGSVAIAFERRDPTTMRSAGIFVLTGSGRSFAERRRFSREAYGPRVRLASDGSLHLAFRTAAGALVYRTDATSAWVTEIVAPDGCCSGGPALALEGSVPLIAWARDPGRGARAGRLRLSVREGGGWSSELVTTSPSGDPALEVGEAGPVIASVRPGSGTWLAMRAGEPGAVWGHQRVGPRSFDPPDVAISPRGDVVVVHGDGVHVFVGRLQGADLATAELPGPGSDFDPEVALVGERARVVFNRTPGTPGDGVYLVRQR